MHNTPFHIQKHKDLYSCSTSRGEFLTMRSMHIFKFSAILKPPYFVLLMYIKIYIVIQQNRRKYNSEWWVFVYIKIYVLLCFLLFSNRYSETGLKKGLKEVQENMHLHKEITTVEVDWYAIEDLSLLEIHMYITVNLKRNLFLKQKNTCQTTGFRNRPKNKQHSIATRSHLYRPLLAQFMSCIYVAGACCIVWLWPVSIWYKNE